MPRLKKGRILALSAVALAGLAAYLFIPLLFLPSVSALKDPKANLKVAVRDWKGKEHSFVVGPKNKRWTPISRIPAEMKWAVVVAEDGRFFEHQGVDYRALKAAIQYDLEKKRFARGASTITQQVAKNLFLSREKTITRKVRELVLAHRIEQELTKGRILELYLNVVELGPMVHGIGHGARYYFDKPASALTPRESAFLAAMLPGPRVAFNPYRNLRKVEKYAEKILLRMRQRGILSKREYRQAMAQELNIAGLERKVKRTLESPPPPEELIPDDAALEMLFGPMPEDLPAEDPQAPVEEASLPLPAGGEGAENGISPLPELPEEVGENTDLLPASEETSENGGRIEP